MKTLFILILLFLSIFLYSGWPDQDAYSAYNRACNGIDSNPGLPAWDLFLKAGMGGTDNPECSEIGFKILQFLLITVSLLTIYVFFGEKIALLGYFGYAITFFFTIEDDLLAFPIILYSSWLLFEKKIKLWQYALIIFFTGFFIWKGAFLVGAIVFAHAIRPIYAFFPLLAYFYPFNLDDWGKSLEATVGTGFFIGSIGGIIYGLKKINLHTFLDKKFYLLYAFTALSFLQPKWGEWIILPLFPLLSEFYDELPKYQKKIMMVMGIFLTILIIGIIFTTPSFPSQEQWHLIREGVAIQDQNQTVLTDWGVGHYFEYAGGVASQKGGFSSFQDANGSYWIGGFREDCLVVSKSDKLFLLKC